MTPHPDDSDLREFVRHTLAADRLLMVGDHLAECEACRSRAASIGDVATAIGEAADELRGFGTGPDTRSRPRATFYRYLPLAAAIVLLALTPFAISRWWPGVPAPASPLTAGLDQLSAERRAGVESALAGGVAEIPQTLADLMKGPEVLMGQEPPVGFRLVAPLMTVTIADRPEFRWQPMAGADDYTVAVFDIDLQPVAGPVATSATTWTPQRALPRAREYVWQVTARRGSTSVTVPAPPQPLARFRVMDAAAAADLERLTNTNPGSHVVLGIALAQAGARQEALAHLRQVAPTDPHAPLAQRTAERLEAVAGPR